MSLLDLKSQITNAKKELDEFTQSTELDINIDENIVDINISDTNKKKQQDAIIESVMTSLFTSTPKELIPMDPDKGGLPAILKVLSDMIMEAIETFAKQFFYFKKTIDKLAGLELGELLGTYIPGIVKVLNDLKTMLSDTSSWIMKTLLGPLFEISIPIPEMTIDLNDFIPMLPHFKLKIPKIDNYNFFTGITPFNPNLSIDEIPLDWYENIMGEILKEKKIEKETAEKIKEDKLIDINNNILELNNKLYNKNKYTKQVEQSIAKIKKLKNDETCDNCDKELICKQIDDEKNKLNNLIELEKKEDILISALNKNQIKDDIEKLKKQYQIIKNNKALTKSEILNRTFSLSYTEKINNYKLDQKLITLYDLGIDIYDNSLLELLQKIGYDLSSEEYLNQFNIIKKIGFTKKDLTFLYEIGFNFNDPEHINKINKIKNYSSTVLVMLLDIGFNLSKKSFDIIDELIKLNIDISDDNMILKLHILGFNFNNPYSINRLKKLLKYININEIEKYELIMKNININNPYYLDVLEKSFRIGIRWGENYIETEQKILLDKQIPTNVDIILDSMNKYTLDVLYTIIDALNIYKEYGIELFIKNDSIDTSNNAISVFISKLELLKEFNINKGWYKNGIRLDEKINETTYNSMISGLKDSDGNNLTTTNLINHDSNKISFSVLKGIYDNFSELSLNNNDPLFNEKINSIFNNFNITIDSSVMLDTTKVVLLTYTDFKHVDKKGHHPIKTIDLSKNKANPEFYTDQRYNVKISIKDVANKNYINQPTKTLAQFEVLQKLGFNFQNDDYYKFISKFSALNLNLKKIETKLITDALISIGWHWSIDQDFKKLDNLIKNGLSFKIKNESTDIYVSQTYTKLEHLNTWGFNLNNKNYNDVLSIMNQLNIKLNNNDFDSIIENLIGFGISLKSNDWKQKLDTLKKLNFNFKKENWKIQLDNLQLLGIDFTKKDWNKNYNKIMNMNDLGFNFSDDTINKKITILTDLGIDFSGNDWQSKIESLIQLKLIMEPNNVKKDKITYHKELNEKINNINEKIELYRNLNINPTYVIDNEIQELEEKININSKCDLINLLEDKKLQRISIIRLKPDYTKDIEKLNIEKNNITDNSFKINKNLIFESEEKFKILESSGIDFFNKDYKNIISNLVSVGLNFSVSTIDLKNKLSEIKDMIPINAALEWSKGMVKTIKVIVMLPMQLLMGIIEKLIEMINQLIGIPLNITKIPEWTKGIMIKFKDLIDLIIKLPTKEGLMDILFMSDKGFMLIDIYVPGFSKFMKKLMSMLSTINDKITVQRKKVSQLKSKLIDLKNKEALALTAVSIATAVITNNTLNNKKIQLIEEQKSLEIKSQSTKLSKEEEQQLKTTCKLINYIDDLNTTDHITAEKELKKIKEDSNNTNIELKKSNNELNELLAIFATFDISVCLLNNDVDKLIENLKKLLDKITGENTYKKKSDILNKKIKKYETAKIISLEKEQTEKTKEIIDKLNTKIKELKIQKVDLDKKSTEFEKNKQKEIDDLTNITKHFPVLLGIICSAPKMIANIFVGILNKVGEMDNLPNLWEFPLVE